MRPSIIAVIAACYVTPALADGPVMPIRPFAAGISFEQRMNECVAAWYAMRPAEQERTTYRAYSTACIKAGSDGTARTPVPPAGATAKCRDNTYSRRDPDSGACAKHGGVDMTLWMTL